MSKKAWPTLALLTVGGCRTISQQELADFKPPPSLYMASIDQTWQNKIVPQIVGQARPTADLLTASHAEEDFNSACKGLDYRSQGENPCILCVQIEEKIGNPDTTSRNGEMIIANKSGNSIIVQIGPTLRGMQLRGALKGTSYSNFNNQTLPGEYDRGVNEQAMKMIQSA